MYAPIAPFHAVPGMGRAREDTEGIFFCDVNIIISRRGRRVQEHAG